MADIVNYLQQINNAADDIEQIAKALKILPKIEPYADNMLDSIIIIRANINCIQDIPHIYDKTVDVQPVNQWISVDDKLPDDCVEVLVYDTDCGIVIGWYDKETGDFAADFISPLDAVTHWQPLPEPPKEVNNG